MYNVFYWSFLIQKRIQYWELFPRKLSFNWLKEPSEFIIPGWINLKKDLDKFVKFYNLNFYIFNGLEIVGFEFATIATDLSN